MSDSKKRGPDDWRAGDCQKSREDIIDKENKSAMDKGNSFVAFEQNARQSTLPENNLQTTSDGRGCPLMKETSKKGDSNSFPVAVDSFDGNNRQKLSSSTSSSQWTKESAKNETSCDINTKKSYIDSNHDLENKHHAPTKESQEASNSRLKKLDEEDKKRISSRVTLNNDQVHDTEEEDDDNQVIPLWPSKSECKGSRDGKFLQHKVYSLKDYSQVASPTATPQRQAEEELWCPVAPAMSGAGSSKGPKVASSTGNRLLKSMSQDRKVKANTKRLSECLYLTSATPALLMGQPPVAQPGAVLGPRDKSGKVSSAKKMNPSLSQTPGLVTGSSSGNLLAGPSGSASGVVLIGGESRIDRMRKLFVSPLSLRSSGPSGKSAHGHSQAVPSFQQRLSFQAGASSMLNKPQYLMHAMYRTGGGGTGKHHKSGRQSKGQSAEGDKGFRVYGCPLQMANNIYPITCFGRADIYKQQSVPYVLARLCNYIEENSSHLEHEGIFRVSGNARLMEKLRTLFDHLGDAPLEDESVDVATSASMLKMYLRELPEPLIPTRMNYYFITLAKKYSPYLMSESVSGTNSLSYGSSGALYKHYGGQPPNLQQKSGHQFSSSAGSSTGSTAPDSASSSQSASGNERQRVAFSRDLTKLVRKLPIENYNLLKYLACFLYRISLKQEYNKMCAEALGIVFGPNIFRIRSESYKGLKEQELSNQIMASIISNYRAIFDSELTDPLGNLVEAATGCAVAASDLSETAELLAEGQQDPASSSTAPLVVGSSVDASDSSGPTLVEAADKLATANVIKSSPKEGSNGSGRRIDLSKPPQSCSRGEQEMGAACCLGHSNGHLLTGMKPRGCARAHDAISDPEDNLEEEEEEEDDCIDEEEEEGGSYTPSSGTGSYCSSIGSETIESSEYEEEEGGEVRGHRPRLIKLHRLRYNDKNYDGHYLATGAESFRRYRHAADGDEDIYLGDEDDEEELDEEGSTSDCGSDTSYTPTSSHSGESDLYEEEIDGSGQEAVDFSSSSSLDESERAALAAGNAEDSQHPVDSGANLLRGQQLRLRQRKQQQPRLVSTTCRVCKRRESAHLERLANGQLVNTKICASKSPNQSNNNEPVAANELDTKQELKEQLSSEAEAKNIAQGSATEAQAAEDREISSPVVEPSSSIQENKIPVKVSTGSDRRPTSQPVKRLDYLRRRSSSASSLGHMQRVMRAHRTLGNRSPLVLNAPNPETRVDGLRTGRGTSTATTSTRQHHSSSTRARRVHGHSIRRQAQPQQQKQPEVRGSMTSRNHQWVSRRSRRHHNIVAGSSSHHRPRHIKLARLVYSNQMKADDRFERRRWISRRPGAESYFLLRSFNSDETLWRSFAFGASKNEPRPVKSRRRRLSGSHYASNEPAEVVERNKSLRRRHKQKDGRSDHLNRDGEDKLASIEPSVISLINETDGNRLVKSKPAVECKLDVSLNAGEESEASTYSSGSDSILSQMRATRELIKAMFRLLDYGLSRGYTNRMESLIQRLSWVNESCDESTTDANATNDDCFACLVDPASATVIVELIDYHLSLQLDEDELAHAASHLIQSDKLNDMLSASIQQLGRRYLNLRSIRDHYLKMHATSLEQNLANKNTVMDADSDINDRLEGLAKRKSGQSLDLMDSGGDRLKAFSLSSFTTSPCSTVRNSIVASESTAQIFDNLASKEADDGSRQPGSKPSAATAFKGCEFGYLCPIEFVFSIEKQLTSKRNLGVRPNVRLNDFTMDELTSEKLELQKNLLRYEHWFGRPRSRLEFSFVGHIYERYHVVKTIKSNRLRKLENGGDHQSDLQVEGGNQSTDREPQI